MAQLLLVLAGQMEVAAQLSSIINQSRKSSLPLRSPFTPQQLLSLSFLLAGKQTFSRYCLTALLLHPLNVCDLNLAAQRG
jgi:hypothetical protein